MAERLPVLSEHQLTKSANTTNPAGYTPTPEEKAAIKIAEKCFEKAKKARKKYDEKWLEDYKMFRGRQWPETRPSYRHSEVINMIFQHIQSVVPILTDARQRFEFLPEEPTDFELAQILDEVAEADWQKGNWTYRLAEMIYDAHFSGTGIGEMGFDPDGRYGQGQIYFKSKDYFYFYPEKGAKDCNEECNYIVEVELTEVDKLKRQYPEQAKFLKSDVFDLIGGDKHNLEQVRFKSPVDNKTILEGSSPEELAGSDQIMKITLWIKPDDFIEEEKKSVDADGNEQVEYEQRLKYPRGRKVVIASGVLLEDIENPYEDGLFPFARLVNYIDPREFWGISEIENLRSPQMIFNKLVSYALDVLTLMGNPIWIVDNTSGVDTDNLFNRPGLVIEKEPNSQVTRQEGVQLQPYVLQLIDRMRGWFDELGGSNDVTRGVKPEGITAASAISSLQEAAQTRIRQKSRNLDACLQNLGQLYKNRVFQFKTAPEIIRVSNNPNAQKYFKFHMENLEQPDGSIKRIAHVRNFVQNEETGQFSEDIEEKVYEVRGDFDVRVSTGSELPFNKDVRFNRAAQLFRDGVIDAEEYLKAADYPNWEQVLNRMKQQAQEAQAMQMAQAGGMPLEAGGAPAEAAPPMA